MGRYLLGRIGGIVGVVLAVSFITFFLMKIVPGGPFDIMGIQANKAIPDEIKTTLEAKYGLDKPIITQYLIFLKNAVRLDFGYFFLLSRANSRRDFPKSMALFDQTWLTHYGVLNHRRYGAGNGSRDEKGKWIDHFGTGVALFCLAMPSFVFAKAESNRPRHRGDGAPATGSPPAFTSGSQPA